jgi:hypothetical protein
MMDISVFKGRAREKEFGAESRDNGMEDRTMFWKQYKTVYAEPEKTARAMFNFHVDNVTNFLPVSSLVRRADYWPTIQQIQISTPQNWFKGEFFEEYYSARSY